MTEQLTYLASGAPVRTDETTSRMAVTVDADAVWSATSISCVAPSTTRCAELVDSRWRPASPPRRLWEPVIGPLLLALG